MFIWWNLLDLLTNTSILENTCSEIWYLKMIGFKNNAIRLMWIFNQKLFAKHIHVLVSVDVKFCQLMHV